MYVCTSTHHSLSVSWACFEMFLPKEISITVVIGIVRFYLDGGFYSQKRLKLGWVTWAVKEKRRGKQLLNGPRVIVTMTPTLLSLKRELQADKFFEFDLVPWLLYDGYFFINSSVPFISAFTVKRRSDFWWTFPLCPFWCWNSSFRVLIKF